MPPAPVIAREKTALIRGALSLPVSRALEDRILEPGRTFFDYGCGRGGDLTRLQGLGYESVGWDPSFRPTCALQEADVVNIGYVVNVIEDIDERVDALRRAWSLARHVLVISGRLEADSKRLRGTSCRDGLVTSTGTFQKLYTQQSLREWIEGALECEVVAAAPGVFYAFRSPVERHAFLATRVRRSVRRTRVSDALFEKHHELLGCLIRFIEDRGRLPRETELPEALEIRREFGGLRHAFHVIKLVTGEERWDRIRLSRSEDLLVYLALGRFSRRPRLSELPRDLQLDIRDFFGSYKAGAQQADRLLFSISEGDRTKDAIDAAPVGKRMPSALYVHVSALADLAPILRVREGAARALLGTVEEATLVKFHNDSPTVSYLSYADFDRVAHPELRSAYVVHLNTLEIIYRDYSEHSSPPILHRKETFVAADHPLRARFAKLTAAEVKAGLYRDPSRIGTRRAWDELLADRRVQLIGHRLAAL